MKKLSKINYSRLKSEISPEKLKLHYKKMILLVMAITVVTVSTILIMNNRHTTYEVIVDNKTVGYINDIDKYNEVLKNIKDSNEGIKTTNITAQKSKLPSKDQKIIAAASMENFLTDKLGLKYYAIFSNGIEMAKVKSLSDYHKVISGLLKYYYPTDKSSKIVVTSSKIMEKVTASEMTGKVNDVLSPNAAIKKIVAGRNADKTYKIKNGDTIWDIALDNNIGVDDIKAANPHLNLDKIKIGQVIRLAVSVPYVNVRIAAIVNSVEQIPHDTKTVHDAKVRRGIKRLRNPGHNGLASIHKKIVVNNDDVISEVVTASKTIKRPVDAVVAIGSQVPLYAATGVFMRPSRGVMSSPFGRRWGKMHEGIDLAGPTGSPIDAADSGKVAFVGIRNGYGLCVMINHGNGLQTLYGHTSKTFVKIGQSVAKGQRIASVGCTGHATGPHLHFEVRKNGVAVNPLMYLNRARASK